MANTLMKWEFEELDEAMGIIPLEERVIKTTDGQIKLKIVATQKKDGGVRYQVGVYYPTSVLRMPGIDSPLPREDIYALYNAISTNSRLSETVLIVMNTCGKDAGGRLKDYLKFLEVFI